ncbi:hypothetical protein LTR05_006360 [Lithohypha guttulata]|uniref:glucan endo-1,6-beta-glucosidase n=1 Tax=Lithohypha guttulata TaxID=1690604 RepID=A0AAN7YEY1_9EURO|nr:hypothetical protein LTR05_006360 [Lithohypha guttulata]
MYAGVLLFLACPFFAAAWLPGEHKQIFARSGVDLFNRSSLHEHGLIERSLPSIGNTVKVRGVNLGSYFVVENWMASTVFSSLDCDSQSEFDCVSSLQDQAKADKDFQGHWESWLTADDFKKMASYGLNTVRIPVGYWFLESLVDSSEHFPRGGEKYLDQAVQWAKDAGLYVIIELHGAPGAQATDAFTGQLNPSPGFYDNYNYDRACKWLEWMTNKAHTHPAYINTVGMIGLVNEPVRIGDSRYPNAQAQTDSMRSQYYPRAWTTIRNKEAALSISKDGQLHIQMMDKKWNSGDPNEFLPDRTFWHAAYDDHQYVKYTDAKVSHQGYLDFSCKDDRSGNWPVIVGEWSLSVNSDVEHNSDWDPNNDANKDFYRKWFAAQIMAYEKGQAIGWCFWSWSTSGLNDPRWDYQKGIDAGIILKNIDDAYTIGACS